MTNNELKWWAVEVLLLIIAAIVFVKLLPLLAP
jgi:hypothetical protein